ncbi:endolysin [Microbacterium phage Barnstormer]|uniref:Endolysin n=1 Tax=Microbacterium phage Barnstormer TaxID=3028491 RepID=A0AAE9ZNS4_9CAUD|nr:endolysin [Microbacterium phage Barnstormer]
MGYTYETINGQRVEVTVAANFKRLRAEFKRAFGLDLIVSSGTRTRAEQTRLYNGWIKRLPGFNLAAKPGHSNHEESGPRGPRALDLRDSGRDAGVTVIGSARSNWLVKNAPRFGFTNAGHYFSPREGWHYEYTGSLNKGGVSYSKDTENRQAWLNKARGEKLKVDGLQGPATTAAIKRYQSFLGITADGIWGPATQKAHQPYYDRVMAPKPAPASSSRILKRGSRGDLVKKLQATLRRNYSLYASKLVADGIYGPATEKVVREFQRRAGLTVDGIAGANTLRKLGI